MYGPNLRGVADEPVVEQRSLREWRELRGLTQEQLEARCAETETAKRENIKVLQTTISKIELAGTSNSKWVTICILAEALEIDPRQLRFETDSEKQTRLPLKRKAS